MTTLSPTTARSLVIDVIGSVAPDIADELATADPDADIWEAFDLDSMDHLNVMTGLAEQTGIEIPERDYGRLRSLRSISDHLVATV